MRWKRIVHYQRARRSRSTSPALEDEGGSAVPRTMLTPVAPRPRGAISAGPLAEFPSNS